MFLEPLDLAEPLGDRPAGVAGAVLQVGPGCHVAGRAAVVVAGQGELHQDGAADRAGLAVMGDVGRQGAAHGQPPAWGRPSILSVLTFGARVVLGAAPAGCPFAGGLLFGGRGGIGLTGSGEQGCQAAALLGRQGREAVDDPPDVFVELGGA